MFVSSWRTIVADNPLPASALHHKHQRFGCGLGEGELPLRGFSNQLQQLVFGDAGASLFGGFDQFGRWAHVSGSPVFQVNATTIILDGSGALVFLIHFPQP